MKSLKKKIMLPVILVAGIGILSLALIGYFVSKNIIIDNIEKISEEKVEKLVINVESKFDQWKKEMNILASNDSVKNFNYDELNKYVSNNKEFFEEYEVVWISDTKGNFKASNGSSDNIVDRDYFHKTLAGKTVISKPIISKSTGNYIIIVSAPIRDNKGIVKGLVGATINLSHITDIINDEKYGNDGYAYMIDSDGLAIAHPDEKNIFTYNALSLSEKDLLAIINKMIKGEEGTGYYKLHGEKKLVSYKTIKSTGWAIGMSANYNEMTTSLQNLGTFVIITSIIVIILISILLFFLTTTLVKPINKLKSYMEVAIKGDLTVQSDINSNDEIGILSNSFNTLIKENKLLLDETIQSDKMKTDFFSNISHELKTPLNIIFSTTQLLSLYTENDNLELNIKKLNKHIKIIRQNSYRLLRLVNNLIDITKIDSGFIDLKLQNKNLVEVVENITLSTVEYVKSKSREIIFDTEIEEKIMAFDPEQMERIILNLISNAVKFTDPNDKIEVSIYDRKKSILISVKDTGIGIPEEKQMQIFERFRQADPLFSRKKEGSGIGLALVKSLVEMHNGTIGIHSKSGEGSEFIIELPVKLVPEKENNHIIEKFSQHTNVEKINIEFSDIYG